MTDTGGDEPAAQGPAADGRPHPYHVSRAAVVLIALALAAGLLIGRASVKTDTSATATSTSPSSSPSIAPATAVSATAVPLGPGALEQTGSRCSLQRGSDLVLAVEVRNRTPAPMILKDLRVTLPKSGLTLLATGVGACGELDVPNLTGMGLPPGGTVWLSTTLRVGVGCPAALAVHLTTDVTDTSGTKKAIDVGGFADLKQIPWSGCRAAKKGS